MTTDQEAINTRALELAVEAKAMIANHEDHCLELGRQNRTTLTNLDTKVDAVHKRLDALVQKRNDKDSNIRNGLILGLLSIVGWLLINGVPWQ